MPNPDPTPVGPFDSFEGLFERAEERPAYWLELGKLEFTEEMLARMKERGITKGQLAVRLQAAPAFVTRLVSGRNNFTLATMVRVARALECEFRCHLQPAGTKAAWINILKDLPQHAPAGWAAEEFHRITPVHSHSDHEPLTTAA